MTHKPDFHVASFPYSVSCNGGYGERWTVALVIITLIINLVCSGIIYNIWVRNKSSKPKVWDVPFFAGVRPILRFSYSISSSWAKATGLLYHPSTWRIWLYCGTNIACTGMLFGLSVYLLPCMGPFAKHVNKIRTVCYGTFTRSC